jgi:uncharacterized protein DUF4124
MPAAADVYRWVDERGVTHYSDRRPADPHAADRVERVRGGRISVYSTDRPLAQVVEAPNAGPAPYLAATSTPSPATFDPCLAADCAVSGVLQPYPATFVPVRRRAPQLQQAVLPPGAIAGTLNANGAIPGNSAALSPVIPEATPRGPRERPVRARPAGVVPHPR